MSINLPPKIKSPGEHAQAAADLRLLAQRIRPEPAEPGDNLKPKAAAEPYREGRTLIVYHLQAAAKIFQEIGEHMPKEPTV